MFLNACKFSQQADQHQHQLLAGGGGGGGGGWDGGRGGGGGGRGSTLMFWAGLSNVTQEPLAFTTPCSAAILLL